jgi:hypothetical protein
MCRQHRVVAFGQVVQLIVFRVSQFVSFARTCVYTVCITTRFRVLSRRGVGWQIPVKSLPDLGSGRNPDQRVGCLTDAESSISALPKPPQLGGVAPPARGSGHPDSCRESTGFRPRSQCVAGFSRGAQVCSDPTTLSAAIADGRRPGRRPPGGSGSAGDFPTAIAPDPFSTYVPRFDPA